MSINNISGFLEKFKTSFSSITLKEPIIEVIQKTTNIKLDRKDIFLKDTILYIKSHPLIKNEIFLKKNLILKELSTTLHSQAPKDIRLH